MHSVLHAVLQFVARRWSNRGLLPVRRRTRRQCLPQLPACCPAETHAAVAFVDLQGYGVLTGLPILPGRKFCQQVGAQGQLLCTVYALDALTGHPLACRLHIDMLLITTSPCALQSLDAGSIELREFDVLCTDTVSGDTVLLDFHSVHNVASVGPA